MRNLLIIMGFVFLILACGGKKENRKIEILKEGFKTLAPDQKEILTFPFLKGDSLVVDVDAGNLTCCNGSLAAGDDTILLYSDTINVSPFDYHKIVEIPKNGLGIFIIQNISPDTQRIHRYYVRIRWE